MSLIGAQLRVRYDYVHISSEAQWSLHETNSRSPFLSVQFASAHPGSKGSDKPNKPNCDDNWTRVRNKSADVKPPLSDTRGL